MKNQPPCPDRETSSLLFNPQRPDAIAYDLVSGLRRHSPLACKQQRYLELQLEVHAAYRNFVRPRSTRDKRSPAQVAGLLPRNLSVGELLSWRQDWGERSLHPLSRTGQTLDDRNARRRSKK